MSEEERYGREEALAHVADSIMQEGVTWTELVDRLKPFADARGLQRWTRGYCRGHARFRAKNGTYRVEMNDDWVKFYRPSTDYNRPSLVRTTTTNPQNAVTAPPAMLEADAFLKEKVFGPVAQRVMDRADSLLHLARFPNSGIEGWLKGRSRPGARRSCTKILQQGPRPRIGR